MPGVESEMTARSAPTDCSAAKVDWIVHAGVGEPPVVGTRALSGQTRQSDLGRAGTSQA